jgi:EAL domain-containing protein (putative c-di-GMP-specific phosphodiesterase class I)
MILARAIRPSVISTAFPSIRLKIDRSFIHRLMAYYSSKPIVEAILALGHKLDLDLVAEGVETVEELQWLQTHGCEYVQGFLLAPPAPAQRHHHLAVIRHWVYSQSTTVPLKPSHKLTGSSQCRLQ